MAFEIIKLTY